MAKVYGPPPYHGDPLVVTPVMTGGGATHTS